MLNNPWQERLKADLQRLNTTDHPARLAVLGIGHELCGDDAVGTRIAAMLNTMLPNEPRLLAIEAGPAPENFTGSLRHYKPDLILMIDAARLDEEPGTIRWLNLQELDGLSASTHTLPLDLLITYLNAELGCGVELIGIQPEQTFADMPLTPSVQKAAEEILGVLVDCLRSQGCLSSKN